MTGRHDERVLIVDKPQAGSVVIAQRDIIRPDGLGGTITIREGTSLLVTDGMYRKGYDRPGRIGVRVPGTASLSIGVQLGVDVYVCALSHEHYIGTDGTGDGIDCHPAID